MSQGCIVKSLVAVDTLDKPIKLRHFSAAWSMGFWLPRCGIADEMSAKRVVQVKLRTVTAVYVDALSLKSWSTTMDVPALDVSLWRWISSWAIVKSQIGCFPHWAVRNTLKTQKRHFCRILSHPYFINVPCDYVLMLFHLFRTDPCRTALGLSPPRRLEMPLGSPLLHAMRRCSVCALTRRRDGTWFCTLKPGWFLFGTCHW